MRCCCKTRSNNISVQLEKLSIAKAPMALVQIQYPVDFLLENLVLSIHDPVVCQFDSIENKVSWAIRYEATQPFLATPELIR